MATRPIEATEIETTDLTRQQLGAYIRKELQSASTKSVQVYNKGSKEFARTWVIGFDYAENNIVRL